MALLSNTLSTRRARAVLLVILMMAMAPIRLGHAAEPQDEYALRAAFLLNFARLVKWPSESAPAAGEALVFCVLGPEPALEGIRAGVGKNTVSSQPVVTEPAADHEGLEGCHILFAAPGSETTGSEWVEASHGHHVLTVGESPGFAADGGMINFFMEGKRTRFEINRKSARKAGLRLSSRLLRLAVIVGD